MIPPSNPRCPKCRTPKDGPAKPAAAAAPAAAASPAKPAAAAAAAAPAKADDKKAADAGAAKPKDEEEHKSAPAAAAAAGAGAGGLAPPPPKPKAPVSLHKADSGSAKPMLLAVSKEPAETVAEVEPLLEKCFESGSLKAVDDILATKKDRGTLPLVVSRVVAVAMEKERYTWIAAAQQWVVAHGLAESRPGIAIEKELKLYKKQIETLDVLDATLQSRQLKDIELALNMAEEYGLDKMDEARAVLKLRDNILTAIKNLDSACAGDDYGAVDNCLKAWQELGLDMASDQVSAAKARREILYKRDQIARVLLKATEEGDMKALEEAVSQAVELKFPTDNILYENANLKLAGLRVEKQMSEKAKPSNVERKLNKFFGDDADVKRVMGSQRTDDKKKIDPYNPKSGALPPMEIEGYAIPKFTLSACELLRTSEDFVKGLWVGTKAAQRTMLLWTTDIIPKSLLKPVNPKGEQAYNAKAVRVFKLVQFFMGERQPEPPGKHVNACATDLMKLGHGDEEIRDEIFCHIIKQTTCNPSPQGTIKGWQLLGLVAEAFPPSPVFRPFVLHYLYHNAKPDVPHNGFAKYCMHTLWNTMHEPLKHVTDFTLDHVQKFVSREMKSGKVRVYFLDGSEMDLHVEPWTRVCDSLRTIFDKIKLGDRAGFGVFQVGTVGSEDAKRSAGAGEGREMWVPLNSCLLDYDPKPRPSVSPVLYRQQASRLVFKRRLYQDLTSEDLLAQKLLYFQTIMSICDESLPTQEKQLLRFLALHRVLMDKLKPEAIGTENMLAKVAVNNLLPSAVENYNEKKKEAFFEKIKKFKEELTAKAGGKVKYADLIDDVRDWPLFGCVYFNVKQVLEDKKAQDALPKGLTMGVSSQGVFLVFGKDKKVHESLPFFRILKFETPDLETLIIHCRDPKIKTKVNTFKFQSKETEEVAALLTTIQEDIQNVTARE